MWFSSFFSRGKRRVHHRLKCQFPQISGFFFEASIKLSHNLIILITFDKNLFPHRFRSKENSKFYLSKKKIEYSIEVRRNFNNETRRTENWTEKSERELACAHDKHLNATEGTVRYFNEKMLPHISRASCAMLCYCCCWLSVVRFIIFQSGCIDWAPLPHIHACAQHIHRNTVSMLILPRFWFGIRIGGAYTWSVPIHTYTQREKERERPRDSQAHASDVSSLFNRSEAVAIETNQSASMCGNQEEVTFSLENKAVFKSNDSAMNANE